MLFSRFDNWNEWTPGYTAVNVFRELERLFEERETQHETPNRALSAQIADQGDAFVVKAFVPGLTDKQLHLSVNQDVLTLKGERADDTPAGYSTHRRERSGYQFARSFTFPSKVDPERVTAELRDGVLSVKVWKAPESQPRQITIKAS